eukprot:CAMPEP_0201544636 /NCGR_PEP_ID=MMETSP0173_2-20130828/1274_1 /ASSEMBLY_ACC=CAM_ASM_000268 /TAXON_ID=218659 /ORGANISM="Vexillifera sp., Strain DIVA3 564/2" /LENGTH=142 /DNA_ID=CAMNT_0047952831 /DNA_START=358 /DNA_END=786 /DNA_ORIENTATION=-
MKLTFKLYDLSSSGYITPDDMFKLLQHIHQTHEELEETTTTDQSSSNSSTTSEKNSSSSKGKSSVTSISGGGNSDEKPVKENKAIASLPDDWVGSTTKAIFEKFDTNKDAQLSFIEFLDFLQQHRIARGYLKSFVHEDFSRD